MLLVSPFSSGALVGVFFWVFCFFIYLFFVIVLSVPVKRIYYIHMRLVLVLTPAHGFPVGAAFTKESGCPVVVPSLLYMVGFLLVFLHS